MEKPTYETSKKTIWFCLIMAWAVIVIIVGGALFGAHQIVALAPIAFPAMVGLILGPLGLHRGFGSLDMRTISKQARLGPARHGPKPNGLAP